MKNIKKFFLASTLMLSGVGFLGAMENEAHGQQGPSEVQQRSDHPLGIGRRFCGWVESLYLNTMASEEERVQAKLYVSIVKGELDKVKGILTSLANNNFEKLFTMGIVDFAFIKAVIFDRPTVISYILDDKKLKLALSCNEAFKALKNACECKKTETIQFLLNHTEFMDKINTLQPNSDVQAILLAAKDLLRDEGEARFVKKD